MMEEEEEGKLEAGINDHGFMMVCSHAAREPCLTSTADVTRKKLYQKAPFLNLEKS